MIQQDYNISISANVTSQEAFDGICRVSEWWATDFKGNSQKPDDIFTVDFSGTWVTFKVVEFIPNQIIVWLVTDCYLAWINDKKEWLGTRLNWEITTENNTTAVVRRRDSFLLVQVTNLSSLKLCLKYLGTILLPNHTTGLNSFFKNLETDEGKIFRVFFSTFLVASDLEI